MTTKPYAASIRMDSGLISFQVPEDQSDNESDLGDHRQEYEEGMQDALLDIFNGDNDDSSHSHEDGASSLTGEMTFNREINEKNAQLKNATSTPFASGTRRLMNTLHERTIVGESTQTPALDRRGRSDFRVNVLNERHERPNLFSGKLDIVQEGEKAERSASERSGKDASYGVKTTSPTVSPSSYGRLKGAEPSSYSRLKGVEQAISRELGASGGRAAGGRGDHILYRSADGSGTDHLLAQDSLYPTPVKTQQNLLDQTKDRHILQLQADLTSQCQAMEGEVLAYKQIVHDMSQENEALESEREKDQLTVRTLQDQLHHLRTQLKDTRDDLDTIKEEKQELLRKLYINEGTTNQLKSTMEEMTSWETIDNLKRQNEQLTLQMKEVHQTEIRKTKEERTKETFRLQTELSLLQQETETLKEKLEGAETVKAALQKELTLKVASDSDRRQEHQAMEVLQLQLKTKSEEVARLMIRNAELNAAYTVKCEELSAALEEKMKVSAAHSALHTDHTHLKDENLSLKTDHALTLQKKTSEIQTLQQEVADLKRKSETLEKERSSLLNKVSSLQKDLTTKNASVPTTSRQSFDLMQQEVKRKDDELSSVKRQWREVQDNLHGQLKCAAVENEELRQATSTLRQETSTLREETVRLKEENAVLHADVHLMKKVLKKLKKHITGNPSPSGDSGISTENKTQETGRSGIPTTDGEDTLGDGGYMRELITMKGDLRLEMQREYQQQLDIDRQKIIAQIDAVYMHKLQQVLMRVKSDKATAAATPGTGSHHHSTTAQTIHTENGCH